MTEHDFVWVKRLMILMNKHNIQEICISGVTVKRGEKNTRPPRIKKQLVVQQAYPPSVSTTSQSNTPDSDAPWENIPQVIADNWANTRS